MGTRYKSLKSYNLLVSTQLEVAPLSIVTQCNSFISLDNLLFLCRAVLEHEVHRQQVVPRVVLHSDFSESELVRAELLKVDREVRLVAPASNDGA